MANKKWVSKIETITDRARDELEKLAEEYRQQVLIPLCRKHKYTFISGMGTFFFVVKFDGKEETVGIDNVNYYVAGDNDYLIKKQLAPIIDTLNYEAMSRDDCLGFYVKDIKESDY